MHPRDRRTAVVAAQGGRDRQHRGDRVERVIAIHPVEDVAGSRALAQPILGDVRLEQHDEPIGLIVRKRPQQHGVDECEERGRRRDAKSEKQRNAERDTRRSQHRPQRLREIVPRADEQAIPRQGQPRPRLRDAAAGASVREQPFAIFADGTPIDRHARAAFRNARLERA